MSHANNFDILQPAGFQWYAHDRALSGSGGLREEDLRDHRGTPDSFTWRRYFRETYKHIGARFLTPPPPNVEE